MDDRERLQEMFPYIDPRIVAATVREHANDFSAAFQYLRFEVVPALYKAYLNLLGEELDMVVSETEKVLEAEESIEKIVEVVKDRSEINTEALEQSLQLTLEKKDKGEEHVKMLGEEHDMVVSETEKVLEVEESIEKRVEVVKYRSEINTEALEQSVQLTIEKKEQLRKAVEELQKMRKEAHEAERLAVETKMEADRLAEQYLPKVKESKERVLQGRQENEVRAADIYGEKAVLKTEAREVDSRLEKVGKEWEDAMEIINQCKTVVEARRESAVQAMLSTRKELENIGVESFREIATHNSLLSEIEEKKNELDLEAKECTRVREFLVNKGTVIDTLQGEIAVLVEDALHLKGKIDGVAAGTYQDSFRFNLEMDWEKIEKEMMSSMEDLYAANDSARAKHADEGNHLGSEAHSVGGTSAEGNHVGSEAHSVGTSADNEAAFFNLAGAESSSSYSSYNVIDSVSENWYSASFSEVVE